MKRVAEWAIEFLIFSFIGWTYEVGLCSAVSGEVVNRGALSCGSLIIPLLPIYGFGGLAIIRLSQLLPKRLRGNPAVIFLLSAVTATAAELISYYPIKAVCGYSLWDYSGWSCNFHGIVSLPSSAIFGVFGLFTMLFVVNN